MTGSIITPSSLYGEKQKMAAAIEKVARFDLWIDPVFDQRLRDEQDISLGVCPVRGTEPKRHGVSGAHIYHVSAAKDELPRQWFVDASLLRCYAISCAFHRQVQAMTPLMSKRAPGPGSLHKPGGRQRCIGCRAYARIDVGRFPPMLECDRRMRREYGFSREDVMGHEIRERGGLVLLE